MNISGASMEDALASMATSRASGQVQAEITMAILNNQIRQQQGQAAALVKMISDTSLDGTGQLVNRSA